MGYKMNIVDKPKEDIKTFMTIILTSKQEGYIKKRFLKGTESEHHRVKPFSNAGALQRHHVGEKNPHACQVIKDNFKATRGSEHC